jgi:putative tricarboxylic transport membrane protein
MEVFSQNLGPALVGVFEPTTLIFILLGVIIGIVFGALPGFGAAQALAILFPVTLGMSKEVAILFLLAVYHAAEYGGSIPAILIRTPGAPSSAVAVLDGYAMTRKGLPSKALKISLLSGVIGGVVSTFIFLIAGSGLAYVGLQFGPAEMFSVGIFGLAIVSGFFGNNIVKGLLATGLGLLLGTVGTSGFGNPRFAFDQPYLVQGIPVVIIIIGLLAMPEAIALLVDHRHTVDESESPNFDRREFAARNRITREDIRRLIPTWIRQSLIGTFIGTLPGGGGSVASVIAYNEERRFSKRGHLFGTGIEEALAAAETANNAVPSGALVSVLALGIPGSAASAVLLSVLVSKGVVPGPIMFQSERTFIMEIFIGLMVANLMLLVVGLIGTRIFAMVGVLPRRLVGPFVLMLLLLGSYAYETYIAQVVMTVVFGAFGYVLGKARISMIPIVIGFVMGPMIEKNLSRALVINQGDFFGVIAQPIPIVILLLAIAAVTYNILGHRRQRTSISEDVPSE